MPKFVLQYRLRMFGGLLSILFAYTSWPTSSAAAIYSHPMDVSNVGGSVPGVRIYGADTGEGASHSVAGAGDVDGDGYPDLLIGAGLADPGGRTDAGRVYLIFGDALSSSAVLDLSTAPSTSFTRFNGVTANDALGDRGGGQAVGVGDINQDGFDDIVLGATMKDTTRNGAAYLVLGSDTGVGGGGDFDLSGLDGTNGVAITGPGSASHFGFCAGAGDLDADGFPDYLVSAMWHDPGSRSNAGEAYIMFGGSTLPGTSGDFSISSLTDAIGTKLPGIDIGDHLGLGISGVGDFNGDGVADFVLTAPKGDPQSRTDAGEAYLVYGSSGGSITGGVLNPSSLNGTNGVRIDCRASGDSYSGSFIGLYCAEAGDVNGDGYADFLLGAQFADSDGLSDSGEGYLIYGRSSGLGSSGVLDLDTLSSTDGVVLEGDTADDADFRWMAGAGDVNGDGYGDFLIGCTNGSAAATTVLVYGATTVGTSGVLRLADIDGANGVLIEDAADSSDAGRFCTGLGDINLDGYDDFLVGAESLSPGGRTNAGGAYIIYGDSSQTSVAYRQFASSGAAQKAWVGFLGDGSMAWGSSRVAIGFADGAAVSQQTVTLTRSDSDISNLGNGTKLDVANAHWRLETTRASWTTATLTFRYLDSECPGMDESTSKLYQATSLSGPWTQVTTQSTDPDRNEISATVSTLGYFTIRDNDVTSPAAPTVGAGTPTSDTTPTWSWASGGGGSGDFRYQLDSESGTWEESTATDFTPTSPLTDGSHTLYVQERDSVGNWSDSGSHAVWIDSTGPAAPEVAAPVSPTSDTTPTWTWASGGGGGYGYRYQLESESGTWTSTATTAFTPAEALSDGAHTLYVQEQDELGNWSESGSADVVVDTVPPNPPIVTCFIPLLSIIPIWTWISGGGDNGVFRYDFDLSGAWSETTELTWSPAIPLAEGNHRLLVQERDEAGNWSTDGFADLLVDETGPAIALGAPSSSITATGPVSFSVTYGDANSVTLSEEDVIVNATGDAAAEVSIAGSGVAERTVLLHDISGNGEINISIGAGTAVDIAGNAAGAAGPSDSFVVDNTALAVNIGLPTPIATRTGPAVYEITYENAASVSLQMEDVNLHTTGDATGTFAISESKLEGTFQRYVTISDISGDGRLSISIESGTALDDLGNPAPAAGPSAGIEVDNTPPVVSGDSLSTSDPAPPLTGTIDDSAASISITVAGQTFAATNAGTTWTLADNTLAILPPGVYDVEAVATDAVGNVGTDETVDELSIEPAPVGQGGQIRTSLPREFWLEDIALTLIAPEGCCYEWRRDGIPLVDDPPRFTGVDSKFLELTPLSLSDAGEYTVRYDVGAANTRVESETLFLTVGPNSGGAKVTVAGPAGLTVLVLLLSGLIALLGLRRPTARRSR